MLGKTLESPLDCKEIQPVHSQDQPWISLEGMMLKLKLQYFDHLMWRIDSFEKALMLGGIGGRKRRGRQRMRWLDGITDFDAHEFGWTPGFGDGQGGLVCCNSWGHKELDTTERLNWTEHYNSQQMLPCVPVKYWVSPLAVSAVVWKVGHGLSDILAQRVQPPPMVCMSCFSSLDILLQLANSWSLFKTQVILPPVS